MNAPSFPELEQLIQTQANINLNQALRLMPHEFWEFAPVRKGSSSPQAVVNMKSRTPMSRYKICAGS